MTLYRSILLFSILTCSNAVAQLKVNAEIRPRFEYRHGFQTLFPDNIDAAAFVSQRTRLNVDYTDEKLLFYLSVQDIRVWGDVPQLNKADRNGFGVHQAWGELLFTPEFSLKLGRQVLSYDDERILGEVAWAQQARSHDAALLKFKNEKFALNFGAAFNQDGESLTGTTFTTNTYKALQYVWGQNDWENVAASFLFLNNGQQFIDELNEANNDTRYSQTLGTHLKYDKGKFGLLANLYYQFGKDVNDNSLNAYLLGLEANFIVLPTWSLAIGTELQSGNDNGVPATGKNKAFTPLYGTNHKFNGLMDYFFVGNHINNVGLLDFYLGANIKTSEKTGLNVRLHNFNAEADLTGTDSKQLGTEADLVFNYNFDEAINIKAGYSHLFPSEGMDILKNNFDDNSNYWGWAMVTIKPVLFKTQSK